MAPSPEYDKEPKAPDKSATNISNEDSKLLHTLLNDQHHNSDHKTTNSAMNSEVENNKHVETLDDDKLRALLNEALTYKCPKDREGKSSLFKELLEEVEQDDQEACEAAARSLTGCRGSRRGARGRRALPHSNSLQDLVAALAAEPAPRRAHARPHAPAPAPASVSARAIHGGSLPSGVDTSSLLSEEGSCRSAGGGYLATVRCVNPPPLAERRVSAGDDAAPTDLDPLHRRSKPMFPMTYTARATLEIGSGSVCSGRAVTTTTASNQMSDMSTPRADDAIGGSDTSAMKESPGRYDDIELEEVAGRRHRDRDTSFARYLAGQEKLMHALHAAHTDTDDDDCHDVLPERNNNTESSKYTAHIEYDQNLAHDVSSESDVKTNTNTENDATRRASRSVADSDAPPAPDEAAVALERRARDEAPADRYILAELPNNAYIFLTLPKRSLPPVNRERSSAEGREIESAARPPEGRPDRKKDKPAGRTATNTRRRDAITKNALRALLFENLLKNDRGEPAACRARSASEREVDSAIPFSCISSPEVVAACTTTPSAAHAPLAIDPKPLQLDSQHRAAASVTGAPPPDAAPLALRPRPDDEQPRSVIASSFNGLPLTRPGPAAATAADDYKKSLDENGNSVQGYSSPLSGSGQNKKPRRKKSSKNETVIDCRQLDGYQGHKDVNELLRFIENDAAARPKLRAKHRDDDDRAKKRADPRRKGKDERAASLEELSRTTLEELTAAPPRPPAAPERRSWGDAAPPPDPPAPAQEHADFQTVTKKRRARRRADDAPPRRARAPEPRRRESAPPSDRSNDSNDDLDSVHSLPEAPRAAPPAPPAPPHASYADIARTRHNIPDLIESCNYYGEGEAAGPEAGAPPPPDADPYPALERAAEPRRAPRDKPRDRKERASAAAAAAAAAAAPDVLADRRPAVILLDCAARPRDMDGVTFGFDINEQLVGGGARACDLLQHAVAAVPVRAAKRALRWLPPPPPPPPHHHLHQIIDYVGHAWEDAVRCGAGVGGGGGKARYYSE